MPVPASSKLPPSPTHAASAERVALAAVEHAERRCVGHDQGAQRTVEKRAAFLEASDAHALASQELVPRAQAPRCGVVRGIRIGATRLFALAQQVERDDAGDGRRERGDFEERKTPRTRDHAAVPAAALNAAYARRAAS